MRTQTRRKPVQREKGEQAAIAQQVLWLGGWVYTIGTRRQRGQKCPNCGTFVQEWQGTRQTPGLPDLLIFLPKPGARRPSRALPLADLLAAIRLTPHQFVVVECKAGKNRMSDDQRIFRALCLAAGVDHIEGDLDAFLGWCLEHGYLSTAQLSHGRLARVTNSGETAARSTTARG